MTSLDTSAAYWVAVAMRHPPATSRRRRPRGGLQAVLELLDGLPQGTFVDPGEFLELRQVQHLAGGGEKGFKGPRKVSSLLPEEVVLEELVGHR